MSEKLILVKETLWESAKKDLISFAVAGGLIVPGVVLKSDPMQWVGFILFVITFVAMTVGARKAKMKTPEEIIEIANQMIADRGRVEEAK